MYWILGAIIVVLTLTVPRFRRVGVILGVLLLLLLGYGMLRSRPWGPSPEAMQAREAARRSTSPSISPPLDAVRTEQLALTGYGAPLRFTGRITNVSTGFTIKSLTFEISHADCYADAPSPSGCVVLWRGRETVIVSLAPQEWQDFSAAIWLHDSLPRQKGEIKDTFSVVAVTGAPLR